MGTINFLFWRLCMHYSRIFIFLPLFAFIFCAECMVHDDKYNNTKSFNSSLPFNQFNQKYQNISVLHLDELKQSNFKRRTTNNQCCYHQNAFAFNNEKSIEWNVLLCIGVEKYILIFHSNGCCWLLGKITIEIWNLKSGAFGICSEHRTYTSQHLWDFNTLLCILLHMFNVRSSNTITHDTQS